MANKVTKTRFPRGHTRTVFHTTNMSREYIDQARRIAKLRAAAEAHGATIESVILDCLGAVLDKLEGEAKTVMRQKMKEGATK